MDEDEYGVPKGSPDGYWPAVAVLIVIALFLIFFGSTDKRTNTMFT